MRIVVLAGRADGDLLLDAMQAGAVGYVLKRARPAALLATLRRVIDGQHVLPPTLASRFLLEFQSEKSKQHQTKLAKLSPREDEVLRLLATGETNRQIAKHLVVSDETVKSHVAAILRKLQVPDRIRAAIFAIRAGLVDA